MVVEEVLNIEEVPEVERQCRNYYNVEPKIRQYRQYNLARVEEGYYYWLESQEKEKLGHYKITIPWRKDKESTLSQEENRCIYWEEYWYREFDAQKQLDIIKFLTTEFKQPIHIEKTTPGDSYFISMDNIKLGSGNCVSTYDTFDKCLYKILCVIYPYLTPNQILKVKEILE